MSDDIGLRNITIPQYDGDEQVVVAIKSLLKNKYSFLFTAVIVHGSVATGEVIPYSDFDGLLIVKDEYRNSKILAEFKIESLKAILRFDPLQHHGWFEITESDLINYPNGYMPIEILEHSKLIYPFEDSIMLKIKSKKDIDYKRTLIGILNQLEERHTKGWKPKNSYQLKSMLSQIMLLPCLFYSLKEERGIFKKESFDAVRNQFSEKEWMPIVIASKIRANWIYPLSLVNKKLLSVPNKRFRKVITRFFAPKIHDKIQAELTKDFYSNLMLLTERIRKDI
jgi:predicted nucleotidyltransferase